MDASRYFRILRRGWLFLLIAAVVGAAAGAGYSATQPKMYRANTTIFLKLAVANTTGELTQGTNYTTAAAQSYAKMVTLPVVLDDVISKLGLETTPGKLARTMQASVELDTQLIAISVSNSDPELARDIASAVADQLKKTVSDLSPKNDKNITSVEVEVVDPASTPTAPFAPVTSLNTAIGAFTALAVMVMFLLLREILDTRVRDEETLTQAVPYPVLASVPHENDIEKGALSSTQAHSARTEAFRQLRTNLQYIDFSGGLRSLVITSANSGEGKTSISVNLADATAALGVTVLLIDADLRRPRVHEYLGIEGSVGLSTVLAGLADARDVVQQYGNKSLYILPAGHVPPNPSELLGSQSMAHLLNELCELFDLVILDAAPVLPVTDPTVLSMLTDGAILVSNARSTTRAALEKTIDVLSSAGVPILGTVLNEAPKKKSAYYTTASAKTNSTTSNGKAGRSLSFGGRPRPEERVTTPDTAAASVPAVSPSDAEQGNEPS